MHLLVCYLNKIQNAWCNDKDSTLRVSDDLPVHHQESKTVHIPDAVCTVLDS